MSIDPQINGGYDDGTQAGAVRVKPVDSSLVFVPFRSGHYRSAVVGSATAAYCEDGFATNRFGTVSGIYVDMVKPAAGIACSCTITFGFYGRRLGLVYTRPFGVDQPTFTVQVDGTPVPMAQGRAYPPDGSGLTFLDGQCSDVLAEDLADGYHTVDIVPTPLFAGAGTGTDNIWMFQGYLAESRAGYRPDPGGYSAITGTLITGAVAFPTLPVYTGAAAGHTFRYVRKVLYINTSATSQVVTVRYNALSVCELPLAAAGTAGSSAAFDPGGDTAYGSRPGGSLGWQHLATLNGAVTFALIGRP